MNISVESDEKDLTIKIPLDFVYANIVHDPESYIVTPEESKYFPDHGVLIDFEKFLVELKNEIRREDETGWSLVNTLLRSAIAEAAENGAEGVDYD
ncbi:hypothetical protein NVP1170O_159 [Vibrio phage 1.170.O._10N.261.52.C3]|nr:hypothetical protein NVP1170O_159 [Vibrio phage 1.170.O._10N.261.52.C3]